MIRSISEKLHKKMSDQGYEIDSKLIDQQSIDQVDQILKSSPQDAPIPVRASSSNPIKRNSLQQYVMYPHTEEGKLT